MTDESTNHTRNGIGTLSENSLHADLIEWYAQPGDELEVRRDGYVLDILRGEQIIEIQTRNFSAIKTKLSRLVEEHPVHLVYPIAQEKWILRQNGSGKKTISRRKSPRHGRVEQLFSELVRIPRLIEHPNFSLEVLFIHEEEVQVDDGRGSWRRKGRSIIDRRLLEITGSRQFQRPSDFIGLLPEGLPDEFTTKDLARRLKQPVYVAQKMLYCLRMMGTVQLVGQRGKAYLYSIEVEHA